MNRYTLIPILSLLLLTSGRVTFAQSDYVDSLLAVSNITPADTNTVDALVDLANFYFTVQNDSSLLYAKQAEALAETIGDKKGQARAMLAIAWVHLNSDDYARSYDHFERARQQYVLMNDWKRVASAHLGLGHGYLGRGNLTMALEHYLEQIKLLEKYGDTKSVPNYYANIAHVYSRMGKHDEALTYGRRYFNANKDPASGYREYAYVTYANCLFEVGLLDSAILIANEMLVFSKETDLQSHAEAIKLIGRIHYQKGAFEQAIEAFEESRRMNAEKGWKMGEIGTLIGLSEVHFALGNIVDAQAHISSAEEIAKKIESVNKLSEIYEKRSTFERANENYEGALHYFKQHITLRDSSLNVAATEKMTQTKLEFEFEKEQAIKEAAQRQKLERQKLLKNIAIAGSLIFLVLGMFVWFQRNIANKARQRSDELLLNILPAEIAEELKNTGKADARKYEVVSILFTDFKSFTVTAAKLNAGDLVAELNSCFERFDQIMDEYGIEKIKTIGDAYMAAGGIPTHTPSSTKNTVLAALEMQSFIGERKRELLAIGKDSFEMRVGIHTGPAVAGIVGVKKFQYDIWGDTVNTASRMESNGAVGKVNISQATYELIKDEPGFVFEDRGLISVKGKGEVRMWFVGTRAT